MKIAILQATVFKIKKLLISLKQYVHVAVNIQENGKDNSVKPFQYW